jgi:mannose-6-phosphate isomerase-like protein (cupin superfamily)
MEAHDEGLPKSEEGVVYGPINGAPVRQIRQTWGTIKFLATPEAIGSRRLTITEITINPGTPPGPRHLHKEAENAFILLEGDVVIEVDSGREISLSPGHFAWVPPGVIHQVRNPSDQQSARLIEIYGPAAADFHVVGD